MAERERESLTQDGVVEGIANQSALMVAQEVGQRRVRGILVGQQGHHILKEGLVECRRLVEEGTQRGLHKLQRLVSFACLDQLHKHLAAAQEHQFRGAFRLGVEQLGVGFPDKPQSRRNLAPMNQGHNFWEGRMDGRNLSQRILWEKEKVKGYFF